MYPNLVSQSRDETQCGTSDGELCPPQLNYRLIDWPIVLLRLSIAGRDQLFPLDMRRSPNLS